MHNEDCDLFSELPFSHHQAVLDSAGSAGPDSENTPAYCVNHIAIWTLRQLRRLSPKRKIPHNLAIVPTLPLDIVYEIFGHLHPIDLYHLARTNKAFRGLLSDRTSVSAWRDSYQRHPSLPQCPPNFCIQKWTALLFGALQCQLCGMSKTPPDFGLGLRLCSFCLSERGVTYNCDIVDGAVRGLIPLRTQIAGFMPYGNFLYDPSLIYLTSDVERVSAELSSYKIAIEQKQPGAEQSLEDYETSMKASIAVIDEHALRCEAWVDEIGASLKQEREDRFERLMNSIKTRFKRLGYHEEDFDDADLPYEISEGLEEAPPPRLSRSRWQKIRPLLEPAVIEAKNARLQRERIKLIKEREEIVKQLYYDYKKSIAPASWSSSPPAYALYEFEAFAKIINVPSDQIVEADSFTDAMKELPQFIEVWRVQKMRQLASLLPPRGDANPSSSKNTSGEPDIMDLDLATSIFTCLGSERSLYNAGRCLIGWDEALPHLRCGSLRSYWDRRLHFARRGYDAALSLVELVQLDPNTALARDMDRVDHRFLCRHCTGRGGRKALLWRECVSHYIETEKDSSHLVPSWDLLGPEARSHVRRREHRSDPSMADQSWSCNHCSHNFDNALRRASVVSHCRAAHNIDRPVPNLDFVYSFSVNRTPRQPVRFTTEPPTEYLCKRCLPHLTTRLYTLPGVMSHLRAKHGVNNPVDDDDWVKVQAILRSSPSPVEILRFDNQRSP